MTKKTLEYYKSLRYPMRFEPDEEGGFVASLPDLPGCITFGETIEEAYSKLQHAKNEWLELYCQTHGEAPEPQPEPTREYSGKFVLRLPKSLHRRLDEAAHADGVSLNQCVVALVAEWYSRREIERQWEASTVFRDVLSLFRSQRAYLEGSPWKRLSRTANVGAVKVRPSWLAEVIKSEVLVPGSAEELQTVFLPEEGEESEWPRRKGTSSLTGK